MFTRLVTLWETVRTSLWALPLAMVFAGCGLAVGALNIDLGFGSTSVWFLFSGSASQAPEFLSSLVTAMITMATLAISITMVVLTLAAQQLGPRLIRSFMSDRRTQLSLGLFAATVVYLLLVLRSAYGHGNSVSNLAVTGGTVLVLLSIATLVLFVHHLAHSIISDNVIDRVGAQLDYDLMRLLPEKTPEKAAPPTKIEKTGAPVISPHGGYVQAIDFDSIVAAAAHANAKVAMDIRAGDHVVPGRTIAYVVPETELSDDFCQTIQNAVVVGAERTAVQDIEFSIRQLVEIALRALSPGINDPYTADAVLDRLTLSIARIMTRGSAKSVWEDADGTERLVAPVSTFEGITDAAFNQIRQQALPAVVIHMADCIGQLLQQAEDGYRPPLEKHLRLVVNAGRRCIAAEDDLRALEARAQVATEQSHNGRARGESRIASV